MLFIVVVIICFFLFDSHVIKLRIFEHLFMSRFPFLFDLIFFIEIVIIVVAGAAFGLSCGGVLDSVTCDKAGALGLVSALIAALVANQATYLISPKK